MTPKSNKILDPTIKSENKAIKADGLISKIVKDVLGGDLISTGTFKFFRYLLYLALLAFIYIANNYYAENNISNHKLLKNSKKKALKKTINLLKY